jgi:hypothetical protein
MDSRPKKYWFPAKRYGWGWGFPSTWQGWLVLAVYIGAMTSAYRVFPPHRDTVGYFVAVILATAALMLVCWRKGEPLHWRNSKQ